MVNNLAKVLTPANLNNVFSAFFKVNRKTGAKVAKIAFNDGTMRIQAITKTGVKFIGEYALPAITSNADKVAIAKDIAKNGMKQVDIAAILHVSQSTISNWLRK